MNKLLHITALSMALLAEYSVKAQKTYTKNKQGTDPSKLEV